MTPDSLLDSLRHVAASCSEAQEVMAAFFVLWFPWQQTACVCPVIGRLPDCRRLFRV